jgi:hypothetical protein
MATARGRLLTTQSQRLGVIMTTQNRPLVAVILALLVALIVPFATGLVVNQWPGAAAGRTSVHRADTEVTIFGDETIWDGSKK